MTALPNVREMLESKGIMSFEADAPENFNRFAGHADGHPAIVLAKWLDRDLPRKRFTSLPKSATCCSNCRLAPALRKLNLRDQQFS